MSDDGQGRIIVIGAGPAGLAAAYELCQRGRSVTVLEASPHIGGLCRSLELWDQIVDLGPHRFFSSEPIVNELWKDLVGERYSIVRRLTRIHYRERFFHYPLQPLDALVKLGPVTAVRCLASYATSRLRRAPIQSFEDWVVQRFGRTLFEIFFKTYSEKVWGIPCARIDADWAAQRIKTLSLAGAVKAAFVGNRGGKHRTLLDEFAYPDGGTGSIYQELAERIRAHGGEIRLQSPVAAVVADAVAGRLAARGVRLSGGEVLEASHVVSTMPVTLMAKTIEQAPPGILAACDRLYYRNTILVYVEVARRDLFPDNWIYVHSPLVHHGRITNFRNWGTSLTRDRDTSILCLEFWCFDDDAIWRAEDSSLGTLAITELCGLGVVRNAAECRRTHVVRLRRSYPVYETGYLETLRPLQEFCSSVTNLLAIGRSGAFKYNNQDHSLHMGLLAARQILTGKDQRLWEVNTDGAYQEQSDARDAS